MTGVAPEADRPETVDHHEHGRIGARQRGGFAAESGAQVVRHPDDAPGAGRRGR